MLGFIVTFLMGLLAGLAVYFGWQQLKSYRQIRSKPQLLSEDRRYFHRQHYRRLMGCALMILAAVLVSGLFLFPIVTNLDRIMAQGETRLPGEEMSDEDKAFMQFALLYVCGILLVVSTLLVLAMLEMMAIRRYGMRQRRRIRDDRDDMLKRQLPLLRRSRNGD